MIFRYARNITNVLSVGDFFKEDSHEFIGRITAKTDDYIMIDKYNMLGDPVEKDIKMPLSEVCNWKVTTVYVKQHDGSRQWIKWFN